MKKYVIYSVIWKYDGENRCQRIADMTPIKSFGNISEAWKAFPKYKEIEEEIKNADERNYGFEDLDSLGYVINDESDDIVKKYGKGGVTINRRSVDFGKVRFEIGEDL